MVKIIKWDVFSPDGFSLYPDELYDSQRDAYYAFKRWLKRFELQGYYSSPRLGNIPINEIEHYIFYKRYEQTTNKEGVCELSEFPFT